MKVGNSDIASSASEGDSPTKKAMKKHSLMQRGVDPTQKNDVLTRSWINDKDREISELPALKNQAERLALKIGFNKQ
jgi:hypothetical protein